jgi:putative ABC transport system ATP-binding protein
VELLKTMPQIELDQVSKIYNLKTVAVTALRRVSLRIEAGEFTAFSGPSGSGKTTLFNLIACLDRPTTGRVLFQGQDVSALSPSSAADLRKRHFGFVFQSFNLIPVLTAFENIELPLLITADSRRTRTAKVRDIAERLEIADLLAHRPDELSGGQKQRVAIARALVTAPRVVIADEPTGNLDSESGQLVIEIAKERNRLDGVTFLFSSHDPAMVRQADRVIAIHDGCIRTPVAAVSDGDLTTAPSARRRVYV